MSDRPPDPAGTTSKNAAFAAVFDSLVDSNLRLTAAVQQLVRMTWGVLALNLLFDIVLVAAIIVTLWKRP